MREEGFLQTRQRAIAIGEAFDRFDGAPLDLADRHQASADLPSVEPYGAGAAVAGIAADLGAGEAKIVAQGSGEPGDRQAAPGRRRAIQGERHLHDANPASRRRSSTSTESPR